MSPRHTPLLRAKSYAQPSVFRPEHLFREARWQRGLPDCNVPDSCVLNPEGDLVRCGHRNEGTRSGAAWACYHTRFSECHMADSTIVGVVRNAVALPSPYWSPGIPLPRSVVGGSPSPALVLMARQRRSRQRFPFAVVEGAGKRLTFEDGGFDIVLTTWSLCSVADPVQVLQ